LLEGGWDPNVTARFLPRSRQCPTIGLGSQIENLSTMDGPTNGICLSAGFVPISTTRMFRQSAARFSRGR
jgi:hypothetical protein